MINFILEMEPLISLERLLFLLFLAAACISFFASSLSHFILVVFDFQFNLHLSPNVCFVVAVFQLFDWFMEYQGFESVRYGFGLRLRLFTFIFLLAWVEELGHV